LRLTFSDINVSQGSVATRMRSGEIFNKHFAAHLLQNLTLNTLKKNRSRTNSYRHEFGISLFWNSVYNLVKHGPILLIFRNEKFHRS